ncbi:hypothetical protein [Shinella sp.]|uniref:hypothetical protein n=1 Tax=Shinella sp. TaxID=1870904 RepID=UPI002588DCE5|nr:hypothetical protein [Shinella sp.]MCW5706759.1 hypothetical protein [Shinella sp.]
MAEQDETIAKLVKAVEDLTARVTKLEEQVQRMPDTAHGDSSSRVADYLHAAGIE